MMQLDFNAQGTLSHEMTNQDGTWVKNRQTTCNSGLTRGRGHTFKIIDLRRSAQLFMNTTVKYNFFKMI